MVTPHESRFAWLLLVVLAIVALGVALPIESLSAGGNASGVILDRTLPMDVWQQDLVSDIPGGAIYEFEWLVNPSGVEMGPLGFLVVANKGSGTLSVHQPSGLPVLSPYAPLVVVIPASPINPGHGLPTSVIANHFAGFNIKSGDKGGRSLMLIATQDGQIQGWNPYVDKRRAVVVVDQSKTGASYFGLDVAMGDSGPVLAATDFFNGKVDLFNDKFELVGALKDLDMPEGFAPFNVRSFNGRFFVTYAKRASKTNVAVEPGPGLGFINVFCPDGTFVHRLVSNGPLDAPWALVMAPEQMHDLAGMLLVGNMGDGRINAFDIQTGYFYRMLRDQEGRPVEIAGLHGLTFHQDYVHAGDASLYYTAGVDGGRHGLFGRLEPVKHNP